MFDQPNYSDITLDKCPDITKLLAHAGAFLAERFGERSDLGRKQIITYLKNGWGITNRDIQSTLDAYLRGGDIAFSRTAHFSVGYQMSRGASAGGFDRGSRPVSCPMYKVASVDAWVIGQLARGFLVSRLA